MAVVFVVVLLVMPAAEAAYKTHSLLIHPSAFSGNTQSIVRNHCLQLSLLTIFLKIKTTE